MQRVAPLWPHDRQTDGVGRRHRQRLLSAGARLCGARVMCGLEVRRGKRGGSARRHELIGDTTVCEDCVPVRYARQLFYAMADDETVPDDDALIDSTPVLPAGEE